MARSGLGVLGQGPWARAVSVSQGTMRPCASPMVGPHPRLSQQPRRSAAEHGWRTRSHERREDLGGSQLLTPLPLPRLCSAPVAPGVASPKLAAPQKGPFPPISPPLLQGRAELPTSCPSRDPGGSWSHQHTRGWRRSPRPHPSAGASLGAAAPSALRAADALHRSESIPGNRPCCCSFGLSE